MLASVDQRNCGRGRPTGRAISNGFPVMTVARPQRSVSYRCGDVRFRALTARSLSTGSGRRRLGMSLKACNRNNLVPAVRASGAVNPRFSSLQIPPIFDNAPRVARGTAAERMTMRHTFTD